ncbi:MAG: NADH-quinone oxidoreductase subunit NuoN [Gammaproteobacteria bacterium]
MSLQFFLPVLPELFVLCMICVILLIYLFATKSIYGWVQATLIAVAALSAWQYQLPAQLAFSGMFVLDHLAIVLKLFIYLSCFIAFVYARTFNPKGEYYLLGLLAMVGMMVLVSAHNFITLFIGLELFSLPVYAMIALKRDDAISVEAAMKYFIIGSVASGMLLYGFSLLYGATLSLDISQVAAFIQHAPSPSWFILLGVVFVIAGLAFKLGAVPFHMWVPDVYEGAPASVVLFLGTAPKLAAAGLAFRLLNDTLTGVSLNWQPLLIIVAVLSMAVGNIAAIAQTNIKRMLAYSSIAHIGYMTLGLLTATPNGYGAALFYVVSYALMTLGAFGLVAMLNHAGYTASQIEDFKGLNNRNPWLALMMLLVMFSLAGVPPLVGFMAKVSVIEALISVHLVWLAALALLFSVIGAYYYIRVVKVMYFEDPVDTQPLSCSRGTQWAMTFNGLILLVLGIVPGLLFTLCQAAFQ